MSFGGRAVVGLNTACVRCAEPASIPADTQFSDYSQSWAELLSSRDTSSLVTNHQWKAAARHRDSRSHGILPFDPTRISPLRPRLPRNSSEFDRLPSAQPHSSNTDRESVGGLTRTRKHGLVAPCANGRTLAANRVPIDDAFESSRGTRPFCATRASLAGAIMAGATCGGGMAGGDRRSPEPRGESAAPPAAGWQPGACRLWRTAYRRFLPLGHRSTPSSSRNR